MLLKWKWMLLSHSEKMCIWIFCIYLKSLNFTGHVYKKSFMFSLHIFPTVKDDCLELCISTLNWSYPYGEVTQEVLSSAWWFTGTVRGDFCLPLWVSDCESLWLNNLSCLTPAVWPPQAQELTHVTWACTQTGVMHLLNALFANQRVPCAQFRSSTCLEAMPNWAPRFPSYSLAGACYWSALKAG